MEQNRNNRWESAPRAERVAEAVVEKSPENVVIVEEMIINKGAEKKGFFGSLKNAGKAIIKPIKEHPFVAGGIVLVAGGGYAAYRFWWKPRKAKKATEEVVEILEEENEKPVGNCRTEMRDEQNKKK